MKSKISWVFSLLDGNLDLTTGISGSTGHLGSPGQTSGFVTLFSKAKPYW